VSEEGKRGRREDRQKAVDKGGRGRQEEKWKIESERRGERG
jgi:hypothetical protein